MLLFRRSRILGCLAVSGTATDINDADAMAVVSVLGAMGTHHVDGSTIMNGTVKVYHFVITDAVPVVLLAVDVVDLLHGHRLTFRRCRAVDDDFSNLSHTSPPSSLASISDLSSANLVWM